MTDSSNRSSGLLHSSRSTNTRSASAPGPSNPFPGSQNHRAGAGSEDESDASRSPAPGPPSTAPEGGLAARDPAPRREGVVVALQRGRAATDRTRPSRSGPARTRAPERLVIVGGRSDDEHSRSLRAAHGVLVEREVVRARLAGDVDAAARASATSLPRDRSRRGRHGASSPSRRRCRWRARSPRARRRRGGSGGSRASTSDPRRGPALRVASSAPRSRHAPPPAGRGGRRAPCPCTASRRPQPESRRSRTGT